MDKHGLTYNNENIFFASSELKMESKKPRELVVQEQLLLTLESAYPNILPTDDLAQYDLLLIVVFAKCCQLSSLQSPSQAVEHRLSNNTRTVEDTVREEFDQRVGTWKVGQEGLG